MVVLALISFMSTSVRARPTPTPQRFGSPGRASVISITTIPASRNALCRISRRSSRPAAKRSFRNGKASLARQGTIVETFRGIFRPFRCQKIPIAPNQHPTLAARLEKSGSTAPSPLPVRRFHIHSKTACRGASACRWHASYEPTGAGAETKSFCPCQKQRYCICSGAVFRNGSG